MVCDDDTDDGAVDGGGDADVSDNVECGDVKLGAGIDVL